MKHSRHHTLITNILQESIMNARMIRSRLGMALAAMGFAAGVFVVTVLGSSPHPSDPGQTGGTVPSTVTAQGKELLNQFSAAFEAAADRVNPSVVPIFSEQVTTVQDPFAGGNDFFGDEFFKRFFGTPQSHGDQKQTVKSLGSGVIVSDDGYILTNNHVVDGAEKLTVVLKDKQKYSAKVVGRDPQTDVAVIKIDAHGLPAAALGNSDQVRVGQWVIAVGNPFQLLHTVTAGIISAKGRSSVNLADYEDFIQTDASINPGNSGGALADLDGNVIGINTAIFSPSGTGGNVGIGFAIPINMAKSVMHQLVAHGKVTRGYFGLLPQDITEPMAKAMGLEDTKGALVGDVTADGPADRAGIKRGDIITGLNGTTIENSTQLRNLVASLEPGTTAKVDVLRDGKALQLSISLGERPKDLASRGSQNEKPEESSDKRFGVSVTELTASAARSLGYQKQSGVLVTAVTPGSAAEDAGLQKNDLIQEVNRKPIHSVSDFTRAMADAKGSDGIALLVRRGDMTFFAALQVTS
jgi:serine protease Do